MTLMLYKKLSYGHLEFLSTVENTPFIPRKKDTIVVNGNYYKVTEIIWMVGESHLEITMEPIS